MPYNPLVPGLNYVYESAGPCCMLDVNRTGTLLKKIRCGLINYCPFSIRIFQRRKDHKEVLKEILGAIAYKTASIATL